MTNVWQLYDPQGRPIAGRGASKHEVAIKGLLHSTAHIWLWRHTEDGLEVLVQKRAMSKVTWPGLFDKSAGGHLAYQEEPLVAALRKAKEELGLDLSPDRLQFVGATYGRVLVQDTGLVEHEYRWVYICECPSSRFTLARGEVGSVAWKPLGELKADLSSKSRRLHYVPYGSAYFATLIEAIRLAAGQDGESLTKLMRLVAAMGRIGGRGVVRLRTSQPAVDVVRR